MRLPTTILIGLLALGALSPGFAQSQATGTGTGNFVLIPLQHISPELVAQLLGGVVVYDMSGAAGGGYGGGYGGYGGYGPSAGRGYGGSYSNRGGYGGRSALRGGGAPDYGYNYGVTPYQTW
jgi:hypothetical protein